MGTLHVDRLTVEYTAGGYTVRALDELTIEAESGELVLVLGPSGCGKTTLLSCLAGILSPTSGSIRFDGTEVTALEGAAQTAYRRQVGIVFQAFNLVPSLTALENVCVPMWAAGLSRRKARPLAAALLEQFDLGDRAGHRPGQLSGGQQQRLAVVRALVHEPPLVIADEPTANLDYVQAERVLGILRRLAQPGRTVVIATHDERILSLADRVVRLKTGSPSYEHHAGQVELAAGTVLFEQGEPGELVFFVETGQMELVRRQPGGDEELVGVWGPGSYFGDTAPMLSIPRSGTARARTNCVLTACSVAQFRRRMAAVEQPAQPAEPAEPAP
ncbi:MAG: ATP-binding cassette domain-containing protein [Acidimicrobiales bacterium]